MRNALSANTFSRLTAVLPAVFVAANIFSANPANAEVPTQKQMEATMRIFDTVRNFKGVKFKAKDGAAEATIKTKDGNSATLLGYIPKGKKTPVIALLAKEAKLSNFLDGPLNMALKDLALKNIVVFLVSPAEKSTLVRTRSLPAKLRNSMAELSKDFYLDRGVSLFATPAAKPVGLVGDALQIIGLKTFNDIVIKANIQKDRVSKKGFNTTLRIKKTGAWKNPFQLKSVNKQTTSLDGLTLLAKQNTLKPTKKAVSAWGNVRLNKQKYLLYVQYAADPRKPGKFGKAYGIDAKAITLQSLADFAAAMPWSNDLAAKAFRNLPLGEIKLENPRHKPYDFRSNAPPAFEKMIMVAATPGVELPDYKPLPVVGALKTGTIGPLLYANGTGTIFGQKVGEFAANMSLHGLTANASVSLRNIGPIRFTTDLDFRVGPKPGKKFDHEMTLSGKAGIHGLPSQTVILKADVKRFGYEIPPNCPLNPARISGSVPFLPGLALNGISDFTVKAGIGSCLTDAIIGLAKDPRKAVTFAKNMADEQVALGVAAATTIGASITNADKTLKSAWKGSIDAGQTAANTVKNLDKKIASLGKGIADAGKAIKKLSDSISSIGKSIAKAFTSVTGLKKKRKKKKRERAAKRSYKKKLEQKKRSAAAARKRAQKALGRMSPYFDADVVEARTTLSGLRFEQKLAAERQRFAKKLEADFANSSKRKKLIAAVNAKAIMAEFLTDSEPPVDTNTPAAELNKRLREKQVLIEERIVSAAFDKAMEDHMSKVKPDPEPEVPFDTEIRIVGEYNLCVEAYRRAGTVTGRRKDGRKVVLPADFLPGKIRINTCHNEPERQTSTQRYSTQRFKFTSAGKLIALFGKDAVCFNSNGANLATTICNDRAEQIFFVDPTIDAIRPMLAKKGAEPKCIQRRYAARPGAQLQLSPCAYANSGDKVKAHQQWRIAKWQDAPPKKQNTPLLPSLWTHFGKQYGKATARIDNGVVTLDGLIKLRIADRGGKERDFDEPIDTLPPALRPNRRLVFNADTNGRVARIDIHPNGRVTWQEGTKKQSWLSLDNITYPLVTTKILSLKNGCKHSGSQKYRAPSYYSSGNTVILSGIVHCKFKKKTHIATLPSNLRPKKILVFNVNAHALSARVNIHPNGKVIWETGGGAHPGWISLDGIAFSLPSAKRSALKLMGGCKKFGKGFADPTIVMENGLVRISGLVSCPFEYLKGHSFGRLPTNMRPAKRLVFSVNAHERSVRVDILPDGKIRLQYGWRHAWNPINNRGKPKLPTGKKPMHWISLDGIAFAVSGAKNMALKW